MKKLSIEELSRLIVLKTMLNKNKKRIKRIAMFKYRLILSNIILKFKIHKLERGTQWD